MSNLVVVVIILALLVGAIAKLCWNKKKHSKCSSCSSCPLNGPCHRKQLKK